MAKQIKALKCPQCGSTKKQDVKEDQRIESIFAYTGLDEEIITPEEFE